MPKSSSPAMGARTFFTFLDGTRLKKIVAFLAQQDYVGSLFTDDRFGKIPAALPLSALRLLGSSKVPAPPIVVSFKTFASDLRNPVMTGVQVADTSLQEGQGMHGGLGRDSTFNFMAAIGPDFKKSFIDESPVGNADIAPTLARVVNLDMQSNGKLKGRVLSEALVGGPSSIPYRHQVVVSQMASNGKGTILMYQQVGQQVYFDRVCFVDVSKAPRQCL